MKLSAKATAALSMPAGKIDHIEWDEEIPGFGFRLRLGAGGKLLRSWITQFKRGGVSRRMLLGNAAVVSAEQARQEARKLLGKVALGEDPAADKRDRRDKDRKTMRSLVDEYLAARRPELRPKSFAEKERYLTGGYFRPLHGMPVDQIKRADVARRVVAIGRENGNATAREARGALSTFFVWCLRMGLCEQNPVINAVEAAEIKPRDRVLTDDELRRIWNATGDGTEYHKIIRLLVLTGCRRAEIGDMAWSEFLPDMSTWTLPPERSKNGQPHTLPILGTMHSVLDTVPRMASRDQLFGRRGHGFTDWGQKSELDQRAGIIAEWRLHDIRRTVATRMCDIGIMPHVVEQILNHRSGHRAGIASVYNKSPYTKEVRNALSVWHDHVRSLVADGERAVLPFAPKAAG